MTTPGDPNAGPERRPLPMSAHPLGSRSPVTCHFKCGSGCALPAPNEACRAPSFRDVATQRYTRRRVLLGAGAAAIVAALAPALRTEHGALAVPLTDRGVQFTPIDPVRATTDALTVPDGWRWTPILRWGDPLFDDSPAFDPVRPDAAAQALQFGYNNDYLAIGWTNDADTEGLLCCNHEYTNRGVMFAPRTTAPGELEVVRTLIAAHGFSVVELRRDGPGRPWAAVRGGARNRRITGQTPFAVTGPAAGSDLLVTRDDPTGTQVFGTLANCSGGTTPWGTVLSGEENFHNYFVVDRSARGSLRYGLRAGPSTYGFERVDPRFAADTPGYGNEPHRFGWIVEIDPTDPDSVPRKHTALGRFKHEAANLRIDPDGTLSVYLGDDERFEYLYKFVAAQKYDAAGTPEARAHNLDLLTAGDLYVARFSGERRAGNDNSGTGQWLALTRDGRSAVPGMDLAEVLVFTREAADRVHATPMDRCEDVEASPKTKKIYVACTNNDERGTAGNPGRDAANPRRVNKNGHVIEISEADGRSDATWFTWDLFLVCGDPDAAGTYFGGWDGPVAPISCPDNLAFDSVGDLWVATDGAANSLGLADGLFRIPLFGPDRGHVTQFLAVPRDAETCGPVIHDADGSVFVAVQHPGEDGSWSDPHSFFPDYVPAGGPAPEGDWRGPRPTVVQVTRQP